VALNAIALKNAKARERPYKIHDERGLFVIVTPTGSLWWRFKYRFAGKEKQLSLGTYPDVSLQQARERRDEARRQVADHIDPSEHRKARKLALEEAEGNSFEVIAREWLAKNSRVWVPSHSMRILRRFEKDLFPWIGKRPVTEITPAELLKVLQRIESREAHETAHRTLQNCSQIFRYANVTSRATTNPADTLRGSLIPAKEKHHPSITDPDGIGALLRAIDGYLGSFITKSAMQLVALCFVRSSELRRAEWSEFDFDTSEWKIPPERMKMREPHIVPLSLQAIAVLQELQQLTGRFKYVFPGARTNGRPMSENAINAALRNMGYAKGQMTGHGFRSMASTRLNESGLWHRDAIERQLAHQERNAVRGAYNYAEHLVERRKMMQWWADYLDGLRESSNHVSLQP